MHYPLIIRTVYFPHGQSSNADVSFQCSTISFQHCLAGSVCSYIVLHLLKESFKSVFTAKVCDDELTAEVICFLTAMKSLRRF